MGDAPLSIENGIEWFHCLVASPEEGANVGCRTRRKRDLRVGVTNLNDRTCANKAVAPISPMNSVKRARQTGSSQLQLGNYQSIRQDSHPCSFLLELWLSVWGERGNADCPGAIDQAIAERSGCRGCGSGAAFLFCRMAGLQKQ
jgi:hypothetical protein